MINLRTLSAENRAELEHVRQFFRNYAAWLGVDLSFQNFEQEMASLPGAYAEPEGRLFFAEVAGQPAGCVGVRFGPHILRTETASVAVLAAVQALWGDGG